MECHKNNPHHTAGDTETFIPGTNWQVMPAQKEQLNTEFLD